MTYPCEWLASDDLSVDSGTATFMVEGTKYTMRLESFEAFQQVSKMLDESFQQGKTFAARTMRDHIEKSLVEAERQHGLC